MEYQKGDELVNGKYIVEKFIGKGGYGEVYLVRHAVLGKQYALKVQRKEVDPIWYAQVRERFTLEAKLGAYIKDNHLIEVYDMEEEEGELVMRMEYAPGGSLKDRLEQYKRDEKQMAVKEAADIIQQVAEGLAALHKEDVVHRDVKPSNILFGEEGIVKVSDLGLAQLPEDYSERSKGSFRESHPGTPQYMPPEQVNPPYDILKPSADVFALGVVFFEMLTGRMYRMQREEKQQLRAWREDIPLGIEQLVTEMLANEPGNRPWDGLVLLERLSEGEIKKTEEKWRQKEIERRAAEDQARQVKAKQDAEEKARLEAAALKEKQMLKQAALEKQEREREKKEANSLAWKKIKDKLMDAWIGIVVFLLILGLTIWGIVKIVEFLKKPNDPRISNNAQLTNAVSSVETRVRDMDGMMEAHVPAGKFWMGTNVNSFTGSYDSGAEIDENPWHEVYLSTYWIDKYEVTNGQYAKCVNEGGCKEPYTKNSQKRDPYYNNSQYVDYPMIKVDWYMAQAYCDWVDRRIPTEAEWEKAARGTDGRKYPWGEEISCEKSNYGGCKEDTTKVGSYTEGASPFGALDMAGNVSEWVADWYDKDYYGKSPEKDPPGPADGTERIFRGGYWNSVSKYVRTTDRSHADPKSMPEDSNIGIRCASSR